MDTCCCIFYSISLSPVLAARVSPMADNVAIATLSAMLGKTGETLFYTDFFFFLQF
jgi:hypothetical protein